MEAFRLLSQTEGILPAIESSHALAGAIKVGQRMAEEAKANGQDPTEHIVVVTLSGRGDKDVATAARWFGLLEEKDEQNNGEEEGKQA